MSNEDPVRDAEKRELELKKLRADAAKAELDLEVLREKKEGREKPSVWQRFQYFTAYAGVIFTLCTVTVSVCTYKNSVEDARKRDFQSALEHYAKGWLPGVVELGAQGDQGIRALVNGVNATPSNQESDWPRLTLATLDELHIHRSVLSAYTKDLTDKTQKNDEAIELLLIDLENAGGTPSDESLQRLSELTCVQQKLQKLVGTPKDWPARREQIREKLRLLPDC